MPVPADHSTTVNQIGTVKTVELIAKAAFNYKNTVLHFLKQKKFKQLANFFYTKTLVPTGEGAGEAAYYFIAGILQKYPHLAPYPKYIEIEITSKCNKRCIICEHTHWNEPSIDLTFDQFKNLVDQFNLKWTNLTGEGDAFLNKDYIRMIEYAKSKGASVYLTDSFDLIKPHISKKLVELNVDGIYISIDGATPETYEKLKLGCFWKNTVTNIKAMLKEKETAGSPLPELCIRYTITNTNLHEIPTFVKMINEMAPRKIWGNGSKIHFIGLLDYPEIHHLYEPEIPQQIIEQAQAATTEKGVPVVFAHLDETKNPNINTCLAWMEPYFALVPEPMVLPCCAVLMSNDRKRLLEYSFGDYTKIPFRDIWDSPYYTWFRQQVTKKDGKVPAFCAGCRAYNSTEREQKYGIDYRKGGVR